MELAAILELVNVLAPTITNLIVMFKNKDGSTSAIVLLDAADTQLAANQQQVSDWLKAHGAQPPTA